GQFSTKQIRSEVHQHVAKLHLAACRYVRKYLATNGNAFLNDPASSAVFRTRTRNRRLDGVFPGAVTGFPTESDSRAAIFIARFQDQVLALLADKCEQIDGFAV